LTRANVSGLEPQKHHYQDLPEPVKRQLGPLPEGFLSYFTNRFPNLLLHVYRVIADDEHLREERIFKPFFETSKNRFT
jgi:serine/threonine-protein kinase/endoribonuclease IRE1